MQKELLEGIKVAEFTTAMAGPLSTKILSDYGATVIKMEGGKVKVDGTRTIGPFRDGKLGLNRSGDYNYAHTGKLCVAINLAQPKGVEVAKKLVAWADIVVENFAGGAIKRMGLGYEELKKVKPDIIMLSSCMMGQTGPYSEHRGFGSPLTALSGFIQITGWPDRPPQEIGPYTDYIAVHFNMLAILAALDYKRRTGKGQYLDLSQYEDSIQFMEPFILDYTVNRRVASRAGNRSAYAAPHGAFRCQGEDRWCAIAVFTEEEWQRFCNVIGNPAWTKDSRFSSLPARKENEDELDRLVEEWTVNHTAEEVMAQMQAAGVGAGVVQTTEDLMEHDPQMQHRHFYWEVEHPEVGSYRSPRSPFILSKATFEMRRAPLLGEHRDYVLKDVLAMSDEEISALVEEGVIE